MNIKVFIKLCFLACFWITFLNCIRKDFNFPVWVYYLLNILGGIGLAYSFFN